MNTRTKKIPASHPSRQRASGPAVAEAHLPSDAELRRLAERVLRLSDADETEVHIDFVADALTRFANNTIHQNVAEQAMSVSVRTVFDGRTARAKYKQNRRRIAAPCRGRLGHAGAQPAEKSRSAADAWARRTYPKVESLFP